MFSQDTNHATDGGKRNRAVSPGTIAQSGRLGWLIDKGGIVFAAGIFIAMLILIQGVFQRYVLNALTIWAHETTIFLCAIAFIYGGLYCAARNTHIRVVILYDLVGGKVRRTLDVIISVVCAISAATFAWAAWLMVERAAFTPDGSFRLETSGSAWNPPTPALLKIFMFAVMVVLAIQFLDADDYHPVANVGKMSQGIALTDADCWPWLDNLGTALREHGERAGGVVAACSALRRAYRERLIAAAGDRSLRLTANLIQTQRDYFGAHTY